VSRAKNATIAEDARIIIEVVAKNETIAGRFLEIISKNRRENRRRDGPEMAENRGRSNCRRVRSSRYTRGDYEFVFLIAKEMKSV